MRRVVMRAGAGLFGLLALVALALAVWEPLAASTATPPPPRRYDSVIARDTFGVPHIFGRTDPDVAYGVAYAHAEDDFATLQETIAMARGRLGAMTGADGAKVDYTLHLLGARETAHRDYSKQPADVRALLDGYASGLNAYARRHPGEVRLARLFPANGEDIATGFVLRTPFFFGLDATLGALAGDTPLPRENAGATPDFHYTGEAMPNGSNAFVVAARRSGDDTTRVLSNAHQPWRGPVAWYELSVESGTGWHFSGATFPGVPFPVLGHNATLGWTNTVNRPDLVDVYKLVTDPGRTRYRFDCVWRALTRTRVWLPVRFGPFVLPIPRMTYRAVQGPVIVDRSGAYAIRYAGADQVRMVEEYYRLTRARSFAQWQAALAIQGVPATNFLYGDAAGNIAHVYNASFLNRNAGFDYAHVLPGDTSRDVATGTVPWKAVPQHVNPASGFLVNANNTPYQAAGPGSELRPGDYSPLLGIETDTTNRATRAIELMSAMPRIDRAALLRIKYDTGVSRSGWGGKWFADIAAADPRGDALLARAQALLTRWDWNLDGRGAADALACILMRTGQKWHYQRHPELDPRDALLKAATYLQTHFGRIDPPLGEVLRLRRGPVDLPLDGGPEVLRAGSSWDEAGDGRLVVKHGDSFVMLMEWARGKRVASQSVQPYGAATTRPASPHYADQAALFVRHRMKPVWFWRDELRGHVERVYRP